MTICVRKLSLIKNKDIEYATTTMIFVIFCKFVQQKYLHLFVKLILMYRKPVTS